MYLTWYGHSAFLVEAGDGTRVILDPYRSGIFSGTLGYAPIDERADLVVASHGHDDHGAIDTIPGHPTAVIEPDQVSAGRVHVRGIHASHDQSGGRERGSNTILVLTDEDLTLVHLGDLGHPLEPDTRAAIGPVDVLLVPVGGYFTIDAATAHDVVAALAPRIAIPMHYRNDSCLMPIAPVDDFLSLEQNVVRVDSSLIEITKPGLPGTLTIVVMKHAR